MYRTSQGEKFVPLGKFWKQGSNPSTLHTLVGLTARDAPPGASLRDILLCLRCWPGPQVDAFKDLFLWEHLVRMPGLAERVCAPRDAHGVSRHGVGSQLFESAMFSIAYATFSPVLCREHDAGIVPLFARFRLSECLLLGAAACHHHAALRAMSFRQ